MSQLVSDGVEFRFSDAGSRAASMLDEFHASERAAGDQPSGPTPVLYVVYGTAWVHGIDLDAALGEIHRAAMDKMRAGLRRADGKIIKPPGFQPPDMTAATDGVATLVAERRGGEAS